MKKKLIALVLCLALAFTGVVSTAFADGETPGEALDTVTELAVSEEPEACLEADLEAGPETEVCADAEADPETDPQVDPEAEIEAYAAPEADLEVETEAEPETEAPLYQQEIKPATVYASAEALSRAASGEAALEGDTVPDADISVAGALPQGAYVEAYRVELEVEGVAVLSAYDITVFDGDGATFEPGTVSPLTVSITDGAIAETLPAADAVEVFHMKDEAAPMERVDSVITQATNPAVVFEATDFSIFVVATVTASTGTYVIEADGSVTITGMPGTSHSWRSSNSSVAEVTSSGAVASVTAKSEGTAIITHTYGRNINETFTVVVSPSCFTFSDDLASSGLLVASLDDASLAAAASLDITYTWYRSADNATWTEASRTKVTGNNYNIPTPAELSSVIGSDAAQGSSAIYPALDKLLADEGGSAERYYYKVTAVAGDENYASAPYLLPYYDELQNGDFEDVAIDVLISNEEYKARGGVWQTTGFGEKDQDIEIIVPKTGDFFNYFGINATYNDASGEHCAEINAMADGALYQDVLTAPGAELNWSLYHCARYPNNVQNSTGYDTMYVLIMPTAFAVGGEGSGRPDGLNVSGAIDVQAEVEAVMAYIAAGNAIAGVYIQEISDNKTAGKINDWRFHKSASPYIVPAGQHLTRFFFVSGATDSGDNTVGNLVDGISFSSKVPAPEPGKGSITVTKEVRGLSSLPGAYSVTIAVTGEETLHAELTGFTLISGVAGSADAVYQASHTFENLKQDVTYTVSETGGDVSGYALQTAASAKSVTLNDGDTINVKITNTYTRLTFSLAITKRAAAGTQIPDDQSFIFTVTDGGDMVARVVINGTGSATINGLDKTKTYTVSEETGWSWRYTPETSEYTVTGEGKSAVFTNSLTERRWLSGCASAVNMWLSQILTLDSEGGEAQ